MDIYIQGCLDESGKFSVGKERLVIGNMIKLSDCYDLVGEVSKRIQQNFLEG